MVPEEAKSNKRQKEECTINCLPSDLIERIFLRLPLSTLLRCVGVCKQWHNFIRDPQFVTSHLQHAPRYALLFFPQETASGKPYPSDAVLIDEAWSQSTFAVPVIGPDDFLFGSCNGLLGLYTKASTIKIANFSTGECLHLEKPIKNLKSDHFSLYSFGFHPVTKEYKITHFLGDCIEGRPHNKERFSVIQVYTLGDEKWKDIRTPEALSLNCARNSGVVNVNGTMYWLTEDMTASLQHAVMSFDLSEESFAQIQLPSPLDDCAHGPRRYWIREIDGEICIATARTSRYQPRLLADKLQIWTLDNKMEKRWSQRYIIHYSPHYILGPNFVHGNKIMMQRRDCYLNSHELLGENFEIKLSKMAKLLHFSPRKPNNMQSYSCVKSLVRLDVYKKAGIVRRPKQREGWELKKWEAWEHELSRIEKMWSDIHQLEHDKTEDAQLMGIGFNQLLQHISDEVIRRKIDMKINEIVPDFPDQKPRSLQRLNFVGQEQDLANFQAHMDKYKDIKKAITQANENIISMITSYIQGQKGTSSSNICDSSQNHSDGDGDNTKT